MVWGKICCFRIWKLWTLESTVQKFPQTPITKFWQFHQFQNSKISKFGEFVVFKIFVRRQQFRKHAIFLNFQNLNFEIRNIYGSWLCIEERTLKLKTKELIERSLFLWIYYEPFGNRFKISPFETQASWKERLPMNSISPSWSCF